MSQISLYMDDQTMRLLRSRSSNEGLSISKYVAHLVADHVSGEQDSWPAGYWDSVYGCLSDEDAEAMLACVGGSDSLDAASDDACDWFSRDEA